jgi:hypothetical protein
LRLSSVIVFSLLQSVLIRAARDEPRAAGATGITGEPARYLLSSIPPTLWERAQR